MAYETVFLLDAAGHYIPFASDYVAGNYIPITKFDLGADGASQVVSGNVPVLLASGSNTVGKLGANSGVDIGDVDVTSVLPGTNASSLGKAIDVTVGGADVGVASLVMRKDSVASDITPATNDYTLQLVDQKGRTWTHDPLVETLLTNVSSYQTAPVGASQYGSPILIERADSLSTITPALGQFYVLKGDPNGAVWVQLAGALSAAVDSVSLGTSQTQIRKQLRLTASTGSTDLWTPASGKKIAVKSLIVTWSGSTATRLTIWQGANADITHSDTEPKLFDIDLDANANGGFAFQWSMDDPWKTDVADDELHVSLTANKTVSIIVKGYEF